MRPSDSNILLFDTKRIFESIPELPVLYRFLGQEDLTMIRLALMGPRDDPNFIEEKNKAEYLSYYVLNQWEDTNTVSFDVDTSFMSGELIRKVSHPSTHEEVFKKLYGILYPALGIPHNNISVNGVTRAYLDPKTLETEAFKGTDYYAVSFLSGC